MTVDTTTTTALADALRTVAVNGSYNASRSLSKWFHRGVRLTSEGFSTVPIAEASSIVGAPDEPIAAIHMPLAGDVTGSILLTFPESVALALADILMQQPIGTASTLGEIEQSCLQETGNIVGTAYANSFAKWLKLRIEPKAPQFVHDMACAIIDPLLMHMVADHDEVFVAMTDFLMDAQRMQWGMLLLPSSASLHMMEQQCQLDVVRQQALRTIAINGAFNASRSMSKWLKKGVKISTEGFAQVPLNEVVTQFDEDKPVVALHMPLTSHMHGHAMLIFSEQDALHLVNMLTGQQESPATTVGELEQSCLEETGNIISSSFVNSWANWLDFRLEPASPQFMMDLPSAVMDGALAEQARVNDEVFLAQTDFTVDEQWLEFVFLLIPAPSAMRLIETACE